MVKSLMVIAIVGIVVFIGGVLWIDHEINNMVVGNQPLYQVYEPSTLHVTVDGGRGLQLDTFNPQRVGLNK